MRDEGWQARLAEQVEERREWAEGRSRPWWVYADGLFRDLFAEGDDRHAIDRTLYAMRMAVPRGPTDRETCSAYHLGGIEYLVADEEDMPAVMRCVRMSRYHGRYRKAGIPRDDPEYREYRF